MPLRFGSQRQPARTSNARHVVLRPPSGRGVPQAGHSRGITLGRQELWAYRAGVIGFLRFVGVVNAAIWLGAAVFFTFGAGPAMFSEDMKTLLGPNNFPYFSGAIAQVVIARLFKLQLVCGGIAVMHLFAEWLYLSRPLRRFSSYLLLLLLVLGLIGDFGLQPRIKALHRAKYNFAANATPQSRELAAHSLRLWHGAAQTVNLLLLAGLVVYLWRVANPTDPTRFVPAVKLRS